MISTFEVIQRILMAAIIGGLIGLEREINNRPAGLRTHVLVTLGATLIMLISIDGFNLPGFESVDPSRLAAQVVSGIGFLGAGTIMVRGNSIDGLTTAASLWVSAGIGLGLGIGYYLASILTATIVLLTLMSLGLFEKGIFKRRYKTLEIIAIGRPGIIGKIGVLFGTYNISIKDIYISNNNYRQEVGIMEITFILKIPNIFESYKFYQDLYRIAGIENVIYEGETIRCSNGDINP